MAHILNHLQLLVQLLYLTELQAETATCADQTYISQVVPRNLFWNSLTAYDVSHSQVSRVIFNIPVKHV